MACLKRLGSETDRYNGDWQKDHGDTLKDPHNCSLFLTDLAQLFHSVVGLVLDQLLHLQSPISVSILTARTLPSGITHVVLAVMSLCESNIDFPQDLSGMVDNLVQLF